MADYNELICSRCREELPVTDYIACRKCRNKFHWHCVKLPENLRPLLRDIQTYFSWFCEKCNKLLSPMPPDALPPHLEHPKSLNLEAEKSAIVPISPIQSTPNAAPQNSSLKGGSDTQVNIKYAKHIHMASPNYDALSPTRRMVCDGNSRRTQSESSERLNEENHSRKETTNNENIIKALKETLKRRLGTTEARISTILYDGYELQYPIQDYFVELHILEKDLFGMTMRRKTIRLDQIFHTKSEDGVRVKRNILITGDAGFGKTTLAKKLCYDWATLKTPNYLSDFDMVVNIPLRKIGTEPIEVSILNEICSNTEELDQSANIFKGLEILIILDGFDEIGERSNLINFLNDHKLALKGFSEKSTVIVTSRPYAVEKIRHFFDRRLSILGLSDTDQEKYIRRILPESKAENLIRGIKKDPFLSKASECPLILHLLCCVHGRDNKSIKSRDDEETSISSRTELYLQIFKLIIQFYNVKNSRNSICKRIIQKTISEEEIFIRLGKIASESLQNYERVAEDSLKQEFMMKDEFEFVLGLGILVAVPVIFNMRVIMTYEFLHLTFAEFLASIYFADLAQKPGSKVETLSSCGKVLKPGFIAGLLGEKILRNDIVLQWFKEKDLTLSELNEIKNEGRLNKECWELFCCSVQSIEYYQISNDRDLLSYEISLPNLREIKVRCIEMNKDLWKSVEDIVNKFTSCNSLIIDVPVKVVYYSSEQAIEGIRFINMEGIMSKLVSTDCAMRSITNDFIVSVNIHPADIICMKEDKQFVLRETLGHLRDSKRVRPIGLIPDKLPITTANPLLTWNIGSIKIEYDVNLEWNETANKLALPIIVITAEEYSIISKEPFYHDAGLKVTGFKNSPMSSLVGNLKMPRKFGHVDGATFFERLKKLRGLTETERSNLGGETVNASDLSSPTDPKEQCSVS